MSEQTGPGPRIALGGGSGTPSGGYTPLVPTFSPYTNSAAGAVRVAWRITLGTFLLLVVLVVGIPLTRNWYVNAAVEPREARIRAIDGVVFLRRQGIGDWLAVSSDDKVAQGDVLRTAENARAFITLFDNSTVLLYPSSTMRILRSEQGRFRGDKRSVILELAQGRARIGVAPVPEPETAFFQLRSPQAEVHLEEGSYSADVSRDVSQIGTRIGVATAHTAAGSAVARAGQRLLAPANAAPTGALPFGRDLVANGLFSQRDGSLPSGWTVHIQSDLAPQGTVSLDTRPGAVTFRRFGTAHAETSISQTLDADLWDFEKVVLSAEIRVFGHSLSGGGWFGTEYPIMIRLQYRDAQGQLIPWSRGYFLHNRENNPIRSEFGFGEELPSSDWKRVEFNLLEQVPRPWRIQKVEVVAQGHDFESAVRELRIQAE
jgi:hypothetical protein